MERGRERSRCERKKNGDARLFYERKTQGTGSRGRKNQRRKKGKCRRERERLVGGTFFRNETRTVRDASSKRPWIRKRIRIPDLTRRKRAF